MADPVDSKKLKQLLEEKEAELEELKHQSSEAASEIQRMRTHQETLLKETKTAKEQKKQMDSQFNELKTKLDALENKKLAEDNNYDELIRRKEEQIRLDYEAKLAEKDEEFKQAQTNYVTLKSELNRKRISGAVKSAAIKSGVLPTAYDDVILRANGVFTIGDEDSIQAIDGDGNPRRVGKKLMTPEVFVESLKDTAPHLWPQGKSSGATGSGGPINNLVNPFMKGENFNMTAQVKIANENPELAKQMKLEAQAASSGG